MAHPGLLFFLSAVCLLSLFVCALQGLKVNPNKNTESKPFAFRDAILHNGSIYLISTFLWFIAHESQGVPGSVSLLKVFLFNAAVSKTLLISHAFNFSHFINLGWRVFRVFVWFVEKSYCFEIIGTWYHVHSNIWWPCLDLAYTTVKKLRIANISFYYYYFEVVSCAKIL